MTHTTEQLRAGFAAQASLRPSVCHYVARGSTGGSGHTMIPGANQCTDCDGCVSALNCYGKYVGNYCPELPWKCVEVKKCKEKGYSCCGCTQ